MRRAQGGFRDGADLSLHAGAQATRHEASREALHEALHEALQHARQLPAPHAAQALGRALEQARPLLGHDGAERVLDACTRVLQRLGELPDSLASQAGPALERALSLLRPSSDKTAAELAAEALPGSVAWAVQMFAAYSAVAHLAGAARVHPAELWSAPEGATADLEVEGPPAGEAPLSADAAQVAQFEERLLELLRNSSPEAHRRMSDLCAGLAAAAQPGRASVWVLACAVYEALAEGRLKPDVHLKRLGSRLLAQLRQDAGLVEPAATQAQMQVQKQVQKQVQSQLRHELLFACALALQPGPLSAVALHAEPGARLGHVARLWALAGAGASQPAALAAPEPEPVQPTPPPAQVPANAPAAGLAERVPGLPSMADLDPSQWAPPPAAPEESQRLIGGLRLDIGALNSFLNAADEHSRRLRTLLSEWVLESAEGSLHPPAQAGEDAGWMAARAAEMGHADLARFALGLRQALIALMDHANPDPVVRHGQARLLESAAREVDRVLHQFAAGFLKPPSAALESQVQALTREGEAVHGASPLQPTASASQRAQAAREAMARALSLWEAVRGARAIEGVDAQALDEVLRQAAQALQQALDSDPDPRID